MDAMMPNLFLGFTVVGCVILVVFPLVVRHEYLRRRYRFPKMYWIASVIGLGCGAIGTILASLIGLSADHIREAQFPEWVATIFAFVVLSWIGVGIRVYFNIIWRSGR